MGTANVFKIYVFYFDRPADPLLELRADFDTVEKQCYRIFKNESVSEVNCFDFRMDRMLLSLYRSAKRSAGDYPFSKIPER